MIGRGRIGGPLVAVAVAAMITPPRVAWADSNATMTTGPVVEAKIRSASAHYRAGRLDDAIRELTSAAVIEPRNAQVRFMLGNAFFRAQRYAEAADSYRATLALAPDQPDANLNLGFVLHRLGDHAGALEAWRQAVERSRRDALSRVALAVGERAAGHDDQALFHFSIALYLDPQTEQRTYYEGDFRWLKADVAMIEAMQKALGVPLPE